MIKKHILRALVLETLSKTPRTQINSINNDVERLVSEYALFPNKDDCERKRVNYDSYAHKQLNSDDILTINEVIWDLTVERVVTAGKDASNPDFPFLRLTKFGQDYISQSAPYYYDPQGYMKFLRNIVQNLDPVVEQYIYESLNCYRQQLFFAAAVMIGAAAEKAILLVRLSKRKLFLILFIKVAQNT